MEEAKFSFLPREVYMKRSLWKDVEYIFHLRRKKGNLLRHKRYIIQMRPAKYPAPFLCSHDPEKLTGF